MHSNSAPTSRPRTSYLATFLHGRGKWLVAGVAGASFALIPLSVFAHSVATVQGTVNCSGHYSITATGDVYGGHRLIVDLNGVQIENIVENGSTASQTFGPFTGYGATAGESITANADYPNGTQESAPVHNTLTASPTVCPTPTPTPTATPTPTPHNTPTPTPTPTPHNTPTPTPTPHNTPTPTPTPTPTTPIVPRTPTTPTTGSGLLLPGIIGLLAVIGGLSLLAIDRKFSYKKN